MIKKRFKSIAQLYWSNWLLATLFVTQGSKSTSVLKMEINLVHPHRKTLMFENTDHYSSLMINSIRKQLGAVPCWPLLKWQTGWLQTDLAERLMSADGFDLYSYSPRDDLNIHLFNFSLQDFVPLGNVCLLGYRFPNFTWSLLPDLLLQLTATLKRSGVLWAEGRTQSYLTCQILPFSIPLDFCHSQILFCNKEFRKTENNMERMINKFILDLCWKLNGMLVGFKLAYQNDNYWMLPTQTKDNQYSNLLCYKTWYICSNMYKQGQFDFASISSTSVILILIKE